MESSKLGFFLLLFSALLFSESIEKMNAWDEADKEYERNCLPQYDPTPDLGQCSELQEESNSRLRVFALVICTFLITAIVSLTLILPSGGYGSQPPPGRF